MSIKLLKKTAADVIDTIKGAEADPSRIGVEYMPVNLDPIPLAVADATARKLSATYVTAEVTPVNGLRVIQADLPDVVWTLLDVSDITADANWFGAPRTNASGELPLTGVVLENSNYQWFGSKLFPTTGVWQLMDSPTVDDIFYDVGKGSYKLIPAAAMVAGTKVSARLSVKTTINGSVTATKAVNFAIVSKRFITGSRTGASMTTIARFKGDLPSASVSSEITARFIFVDIGGGKLRLEKATDYVPVNCGYSVDLLTNAVTASLETVSVASDTATASGNGWAFIAGQDEEITCIIANTGGLDDQQVFLEWDVKIAINP